MKNLQNKEVRDAYIAANQERWNANKAKFVNPAFLQAVREKYGLEVC